MASSNTGQMNQSGFGQAANEAKSKIQDTAASLTDKAKGAAGAVADKAKDLASSAAHGVGDAASNVGRRADEAVGSMGSGMKHLAGTVREKGPHDGMMGSAASSAADALESGGRYIEEEKLSGMATDFGGILKENPLLTICIGVGLGFLLAQLIPSGRRS